jgi:hypothetical protein
MNKRVFSAGLISLLAASGVQAGDADKGHQLVESNCIRCHGSEVYTRPDHKVTSLPGLEKQVQRCELMLGLTWFDDDIDDAATYLNQEYYKFKPAP